MTQGNPEEREEVRRQTRRPPEPEHSRQDEGDGLSEEDVGLLVGAFQDLLAEVDPGEVSASELRDRLTRLLDSLERAPGPRALQRESLELLRSWSEVWVEELAAGRESEAASVRTLLTAELTRLNQVVREEG